MTDALYQSFQSQHDSMDVSCFVIYSCTCPFQPLLSILRSPYNVLNSPMPALSHMEALACLYRRFQDA